MTTREDDSQSVAMLRIAAEHLNQIKLPQLVRPAVGPDAPPTTELLHWAIQAYSFPWIRHMSALLNGIILLTDSDNKAALRVIGRSSFEFCAHAYYVKKHVKQYLDANDLTAAWNFFLPIATGSRYMNEFHSTPEESELFPAGPHISKAVNCFQNEVMPNKDDYSYLSEFCHPNTMTLQQHYDWTTPYTIDFKDKVAFGAFGAMAGSSLNGLMAIHELLLISNERQVNSAIVKLLVAIADQHGQKKP